jgi:hypothetical protein
MLIPESRDGIPAVEVHNTDTPWPLIRGGDPGHEPAADVNVGAGCVAGLPDGSQHNVRQGAVRCTGKHTNRLWVDRVFANSR